MSMTTEEVLDVFRQCDALLEGHFILSSGLRSPIFLQKAKVFMHAKQTALLCRALADEISARVEGKIDYIVSPAVGGIIPGYETARQLGLPSMFVEREGGEFKLRRGFELPAGSRVVMVEDVVSTGLSSRECIECLQALGAEVLAGACLVDRSAGAADIGVPLIALAEYFVPAYAVDDLPPELAAIPAIKPGSRGLS